MKKKKSLQSLWIKNKLFNKILWPKLYFSQKKKIYCKKFVLSNITEIRIQYQTLNADAMLYWFLAMCTKSDIEFYSTKYLPTPFP